MRRNLTTEKDRRIERGCLVLAVLSLLLGVASAAALVVRLVVWWLA